MPASQGRSSEGAASIGGLASGRMVPARTSTVRVPGPVSHARSTASRTSSAAALQVPHQLGIPLGGGHDDDDLRVGPCREGAQRVDQVRVGAQHVGGPDPARAARRHQTPAEDDDARPLPLLEPAADVTAGGARAVGGLRGEQEVADHLDPPAQGDRDGAVGPGRGFGGPGHRVDRATHAGTIVSPPERPAPPRLGDSCRLREGGAPLSWTFVPAPLPESDRMNWTWRVGDAERRPSAARPWSSTSTGCCPTRPAASTSLSGGSGTGRPSSRRAATTR